MRETRKSKPADDSVDSSSITPVSTEQIRALVKFLTIFAERGGFEPPVQVLARTTV
jgi:hypothetical protein